MLKRISLLAALLVVSGAAAHAETYSVPAGESSVMIDWANVDENCQTIGKPKAKIVKAPQHGKITFQWTSITLDKNYGTCEGKHAKSMRVIYTPDRGYTGPDSFKVGATMPAYEDGSGSRYDGQSVDVMVE